MWPATPLNNSLMCVFSISARMISGLNSCWTEQDSAWLILSLIEGTCLPLLMRCFQIPFPNMLYTCIQHRTQALEGNAWASIRFAKLDSTTMSSPSSTTFDFTGSEADPISSRSPSPTYTARSRYYIPDDIATFKVIVVHLICGVRLNFRRTD